MPKFKIKNNMPEQKVKISERIEEGEITQLRGVFYKAKKRNFSKPCLKQCDARELSSRSELCNGFCYRWKNGHSVVFKLIDPPSEDCTITLTPFAAE